MIRPARSADAAAVHGIYAPIVRETAISFELDPPDVASIAQRIRSSRAWLVFEHEGTVIGYAYAAAYHPRAAYQWSCEVSIYMAERARALGIGGKLLDALAVELADKGYVNAFASIVLPNDASVRLFESRGFEHVGTQRSAGCKFDTWLDVGVWQRQVAAPAVPPLLPAHVALAHA